MRTGPETQTAGVTATANSENGPSIAGSATARQRSLPLPVPRGPVLCIDAARTRNSRRDAGAGWNSCGEPPVFAVVAL